jgi:hypothetical protein
MKLLKNLAMVTVVSVTFLTGCSKDENEAPINSESGSFEELSLEKTSAAVASLAYCVPDSAETAMLQFMREEEYLAYDVYSAFADQYGLQIFINIMQSEYVHTSAIKFLLDKYQLVDPALNHQAGVFQNSELQALYNSLITSGTQSTQLALEAGQAIEITDIEDLENGLLITDQQDITFVLNNLLKASQRHLQAFNAWLN